MCVQFERFGNEENQTNATGISKNHICISIFDLFEAYLLQSRIFILFHNNVLLLIQKNYVAKIQ